MDKIKKFLFIPIFCHAVLLLGMAVMFFAKENAMLGFFLAEIVCGAAAAPAFLALVSMIHAIYDDAKVYDYIYLCLGELVAIGIVRLGVYALLGGGMIGITVSLASLAISVGVLTLWDCIFALIDRFMKKRPGRRSK